LPQQQQQQPLIDFRFALLEDDANAMALNNSESFNSAITIIIIIASFF
jgi:hypothetical protein